MLDFVAFDFRSCCCHRRYATCSLNLDYDTMCGADKFGNVFITRLPEEVSGQVSFQKYLCCQLMSTILIYSRAFLFVHFVLTWKFSKCEKPEVIYHFLTNVEVRKPSS